MSERKRCVESDFYPNDAYVVDEKDQRIKELEAENSRLQELHLKRTRLTEKLQARLDAVEEYVPWEWLEHVNYKTGKEIFIDHFQEALEKDAALEQTDE